MRRTLTRLTSIAGFLLCIATVPPAMSSDSIHAEEAQASAAPEAGAVRVAPTDDTAAGNSRSAEREADATAVEELASSATAVEELASSATAVEESASSAAAVEEPASSSATVEEPTTAADDLICRKETPTGSHRTVTVCRRAADIEASSTEVERTMNRVRQYANPTVTPDG